MQRPLPANLGETEMVELPTWTDRDFDRRIARRLDDDAQRELERRFAEIEDMMEANSMFDWERRGMEINSQEARIRSLGRLGVIEEEELATVAAALEEAAQEHKSLTEAIRNGYRRLNKAAKDAFSALGKNAEDTYAKHARDTAEKLYNDMEKAYNRLVDENRALQDTEAEIARLAQKVADDISRGDIAAAAVDEVELVLKKGSAKKLRDEVKNLSKAFDEAAGVYDSSRAAWIGFTTADALRGANQVIKYTLIDIEATWNRVKNSLNRVHAAGELLTDGYSKYFEKFAQGAEQASEFWKEARGFTEQMSKTEADQMVREVEALTRLAQEGNMAEFLVQSSKFAAPSARQILLMRKDLQSFLEASRMQKFFRFLNPAWYATAIQNVSRGVLATGFYAAEKVLGERLVVYGLELLDVTANALGSYLKWAFSIEVQIAIYAVSIFVDFLKYHASWKFVDHLLGYFFLSLEQVDIGLKLLEYPEVSKQSGVAAASDHVNLMEIDSKEFAFVFDYWAGLYIRLMNKYRDMKYPEYRRIKPFKAIMRVPGRYINLKDHPLESDAEVEENIRIDTMLELGEFVGTDTVSKTIVDSKLPRKPGFVRNFTSFPMYESTFQWPDPDIGVPVQLDGNFSVQDLDPTIVAAFQLWAKSGTHGPVYNTATDIRVRRAAAEANRADLAQYLDPKQTYHTAWTEINEWLKSNRGKKAFFFYDMLVLAPELFSKEWNVDPDKDPFAQFGVHTGWPANKYSYDFHMDYVKQKVGRYTFHPRDRAFYEAVTQSNTVYTARVIFPPVSPWNPIPTDAVEIFQWFPPLVEPVIIAVIRRPARPGEVEKWKSVYETGQKYHDLVERKAHETREQWQQEVLSLIWGHYVENEKPTRTLWGYITRHKRFFLEELMYLCNWLLNDSRTKVWKDYLAMLQGFHRPLNVNSAARTLFMAKFAELAYGESDSEDIESQLKKQFGTILENDVVTSMILPTRDKLGPWAKHVNTIIGYPSAWVFDFPATFGQLICRLFVLDKPRTIVLAFKGTNNAWEWAINFDFSESDIFHVVIDKTKGASLVRLIAEPPSTETVPGVLFGDPNRFQMHRGFYRAAGTLLPGVTQLLNSYYSKHKGIKDVLMTGHSLGAAMTQVMAFLVPRLPVNQTHKRGGIIRAAGGAQVEYQHPHCYMFSSPNVGDGRYREFFGRYTSETVNMYTDGDAVTLLPLFLVPSAGVTKLGWKDAVYAINAAAERGAYAGFIYAVSLMFSGLNLPDFVRNIPALINFNFKDFVGLIASIARANNDHRCLKGGSVFFRFDAYSDSFAETTYDPGLTNTLFEWLAWLGKDGGAKVRDLHSLKRLIARLEKMAKDNPDVFSERIEDIPSWSEGGAITPGSLNPVRSDLIRMITSPGAKVVGYAHTKKHYEPYQIVDKGDVDDESFVAVPEDAVSALRKLHANRVKRRRVDRSDSTYRSEGYL